MSEPIISYHWIPSLGECWRMMCYKPFEVTWPPLTPNFTSLCNGSNCSTHGLDKGLLIKHWWSASWPTPASSSSTYHLHKSNRKLRFLSLYSISSAYATTNIRHTYFPYTIYQVYDFPIYDTISCNILHILSHQNAQWMHDLNPCPSSLRYLYT